MSEKENRDRWGRRNASLEPLLWGADRKVAKDYHQGRLSRTSGIRTPQNVRDAAHQRHVRCGTSLLDTPSNPAELHIFGNLFILSAESEWRVTQ